MDFSVTVRRVLFACDLDSQVFGALPLALAFRAQGWRVSFSLQAASELSAVAREKLEGRFELLNGWLGDLAVSERAHGFDAIGVFATGSRIARFRHDMALAWRVMNGPRPALFCGFNGLVYEKFEEGLAWRLGYDLIGVNGPRDLDAFRDFVGATAFANQPVSIVGLRRKTDVALPPVKPERAPGATKRFVFAEQVVVPSDPEHRATLVATLARLAEASPAWTVTIKARVRPDERTFHEQVSPIGAIVEALPRVPGNLVLTYAPLDGLLETADLFATVSSTALFDAIDHGVPCCVATDFGVRNGYGSHILFGSGLGVSLADCTNVDAIPLRAPDQHWLDRVGYGSLHSPSDLITRLESFDRHSAFQPQAQHLEASAAPRGRVPRVGAEAISAGRAEVEAALNTGDREGARAALGRLGETLARSDAQHNRDSAWRRREGALAEFARRRKVYWLYKTIRTAVLGDTPS